ncbi:P-loop containing nucleoside triphosphate hydrolase protein [Lentinula raphanica]|nr:P-loop containing nucleoside triphosphate hydrolase protein [Lentinula raphanica]
MVRGNLPKSDEEIRDQAFTLFGKYPCLWQIQAARAIFEGKDVLMVAPTGSGKSLAYWLSLVFDEKGTIIVVTPLKELGAQFEGQLNDVGCAAINVTAHNATDAIYKDISKLKYRVVIFSPETMAKDHRYDILLHNRVFMCSVIDIVIDESHVIREWGGTFRPEYHTLGPSRYALPRHIPYHLGTATLPPNDAEQLKMHLNLGADTTEIRLDTDRKNIFHRVQKMKYPANSYHDLAPLVSQSSDASVQKKFLVFFNSRNASQEGAQFLRSRLPEHEVDLIKWIHSGMTDEFRHDEVHALKLGHRLGACATDAVGMGIDIPDIYMVIQYGVPASLSSWYQRLGRAVRDLTLDGCAILLAEPSYFDDAKHAAAKVAKEADERNRLAKSLAETAAAEAREIQRASSNPVATVQSQKRKSNNEKSKSQRSTKKTRTQGPVELNSSKLTTLDFNGYAIKVERSMDDYINAENRPGKKCRREIGCVYFGNAGLKPIINRFCCTRSGCSPHPVKHCCDLCEPDYWPFSTEETFSAKQSRMLNPKTYEHGPKETKLWAVLDQERDRWFVETYGQYTLLAPSALWPDSVLDRIVDWAHENKLLNMDDFRKRMSWAFTEKLGQRILQLIKDNYKYEPPAPKPHKPRNSRAAAAIPTSKRTLPSSLSHSIMHPLSLDPSSSHTPSSHTPSSHTPSSHTPSSHPPSSHPPSSLVPPSSVLATMTGIGATSAVPTLTVPSLPPLFPPSSTPAMAMPFNFVPPSFFRPSSISQSAPSMPATAMTLSPPSLLPSTTPTIRTFGAIVSNTDSILEQALPSTSTLSNSASSASTSGPTTVKRKYAQVTCSKCLQKGHRSMYRSFALVGTMH